MCVCCSLAAKLSSTLIVGIKSHKATMATVMSLPGGTGMWPGDSKGVGGVIGGVGGTIDPAEDPSYPGEGPGRLRATSPSPSSRTMPPSAPATPATPGDDDSAGVGVEETKNETKNETKLAAEWLKSNLLSGGLVYSDGVRDYLKDALRSLIGSKEEEEEEEEGEGGRWKTKTSSTPYSSSSLDQQWEEDSIVNWWIHTAFSVLRTVPVSTDNIGQKLQRLSIEPDITRTKGIAMRDDEPSIPGSPCSPCSSPGGIGGTPMFFSSNPDEQRFYNSLVEGRDEGLIIDEYLTLHSGQSSLVKIGGPPMQYARRKVLAALIKHSGCVGLLLSEIDSILRGDTNQAGVAGGGGKGTGGDQLLPNSVLLEVWRACQRVMQRVIRMKQETGVTYAQVCSAVSTKAELLIEVCESQACQGVAFELALLLSPSHQSPSSPNNPQHSLDWWYSGAGLELHQSCSKLLSEVVEFVISPLKSGTVIRQQMLVSTFSALLRVAGFHSLLVLTNKIDPADPTAEAAGVHTLSRLTALQLQSAAIQFVVGSLREIHLVGSARSTSFTSPTSTGHYTNGLNGACHVILHQLKASVESVYELITQQLVRSTWAGINTVHTLYTIHTLYTHLLRSRTPDQ